MMISVGHKHFIESDYIVEILKVSDSRAVRIRHSAAESGMLINATGGRKIRSIIKLKGKHIVLSALGAETLKSMLGNNTLPSAPRKSDRLSRRHKNNDTNESKSSEFDDQRIGPDRRRFSYTRHIPERRSGVERRGKDRQ